MTSLTLTLTARKAHILHRIKAARWAGATEPEIREAPATAALVRKLSTVLNGSRYDMDAFRNEVDALLSAE